MMHCPDCKKYGEVFTVMVWRGDHYHCARCGKTLDANGLDSGWSR